MADLSGVKVGDVLWYQPMDTRYAGREITVTKVGRKYAYFEHWNRFGLDNGLHRSAGNSTRGRVYANKSIREAEASLERAWSSFRNDFQGCYTPPAGATIDNINQARALLGLGGDQ